MLVSEICRGLILFSPFSLESIYIRREQLKISEKLEFEVVLPQLVYSLPFEFFEILSIYIKHYTKKSFLYSLSGCREFAERVLSYSENAPKLVKGITEITASSGWFHVYEIVSEYAKSILACTENVLQE
jgi:hypothetical protein